MIWSKQIDWTFLAIEIANVDFFPENLLPAPQQMIATIWLEILCIIS